MSETRPVQEEDNASVYCSSCKAYRAGMARGIYQYYVEDAELTFRHVLLECCVCSQPIVANRTGREGNYYGGWDWSEPEQVYPSVEGDSIDPTIPTKIANAYREAKRGFTVKNYDSVALMCRKAIELSCKELGATGNNLQKKLENLRDTAVIDDRIHGWADQVLREIGNEAAHADAIAREDAKDAVEFTKAILDYLFVFMPAFNDFKKRHP